MLQSSIQSATITWTTICPVDRIAPYTGVCAWVQGQQIAIFRVGESDFYAIDNHDPFSDAFVLSRGIVGDRNGIPKVASPIYKQNFNLMTGQCLDDDPVKVATYPVQIVDGNVQVGMMAL
jgi:nitrite reductase (NADH) small subunit